MSNRPKAWMVSQLQSEHARERHLAYESSNYQSHNFKLFKKDVSTALRGVEFCDIGPNVSVVYRPGDIFALGEIGYKNTKAKGGGEVSYYVQARGIVNAKYKDSSWQHHIVATKVLKSAVKAASTHLRALSAEDAARETVSAAHGIIRETVDKARNAATKAYRDLTGNTPYSGSMHNEFMAELRLVQFINPALNQASAAFYEAHDTMLDAEKAAARPIWFMGLSDNYGQVVVDAVRLDMGSIYSNPVVGYPTRVELSAVSDWVRGRISVLSMVAPNTYVQGVGLRLDDRIFYIVEEDTE